MRPYVLPVCVILFVTLVFVADAAAGSLSLRSELGVEYDSNANRAETQSGAVAAAPAASPGGRALVGLEGAGRLSTSTLVAFSSKGALRGYKDGAAKEEGVALAQGAASLIQRLGASTQALLSSTYYDAFQGARPESRDFRSVAPSLSLGQRLGPGQLLFGGGYRWFTFKPSSALNFSGSTFAASYRLSLGPSGSPDSTDEADEGADWDLLFSTGFDRRSFDALRCEKGDDCPPAKSSGLRRDDFSQVGLDLVRTLNHLLGAGVAFQLNNSNSYGDSLSRVLAHAEATFLLPWSLSLAVRGELFWTRYAEAFPVRRDSVSGLPISSIDDEGRSTFRVELMKPLGEHFDVSARWVGYTNEIGGGPVRYRRQTFLLQLGFSLALL